MENTEIPSSGGETAGGIQPQERERTDRLLPVSILLSTVIIAGSWVYVSSLKAGDHAGIKSGADQNLTAGLETHVLPAAGFELPVKWGDLGTKMVATGAIDKPQFEALYEGKGGLTKDERKLLDGFNGGKFVINSGNSGFLLNLLWAFGLSNRNDILTKGPMSDPGYGSPGNFASTGGWTLSVGGSMAHYGAHSFVTLTPEEQALVERVSRGIYRPCCGNSTYFPDCNHGMAMLGLLQLMASQGASEDEMYRAALKVNSFWFPDTYVTIAGYLASQGISWDAADPKVVLGYDFSSAEGYQRILSQAPAPQSGGGSGCGV